MREPNRDCPQFQSCGVNRCPLHSRYTDLAASDLDFETKCRAQRTTREGIAARHPGVLSYSGLTEAEHRREVRRSSRTPEEVERDRARMARLRGLGARRQQGRLSMVVGATVVASENAWADEGAAEDAKVVG